MWALISRDDGHAFQAIVGSLTDVFMGSVWSGLVKGLRDYAPASEPFTREVETMGVVNKTVEDGIGQSWVADGLVPMCDGQLACDDGGGATVAVFKGFLLRPCR